VEKRTLQTTTVLTKHQQWVGLSQGFKLTRERTIKGETSLEVVYGMTSLTRAEANAKKLLGLTRGHWGIENKLHYVRDVTFGEDSSRVHKGTAPQVLAAVRNAVIHLLAGVEAPSRAAAIRRLNNHPEEALELLNLPQLQ
jgi:predicted transposase YbfD/YdcC